MSSQTDVLAPGSFTGLKHKAALVLLRGLIWGIAGGFFGVVFLATLGHLVHADQGHWQIPAAAAIAGAVVGAFYSAKRVANVGAIAGSLAGVGYLIFSHPDTPEPWAVLGVCALAGFVAGALASGVFGGRRGALLIALAGLVAGAAAGVIAELMTALASSLDRMFLLAFVMAPATGVLFAATTIQFHRKVRLDLPAWLNVGIVAAGIASVVGVGLWVLSATLSLDLAPAHHAAITATIRELPSAFSGGLVGGALVGAALEFLGVRWIYQL